MRDSTTISPEIPPTLGLVIGVAAVSTASTFIRLAQGSMASLAVAAWRLTLASLILAPPALTTRRAEWRTLPRRAWGLLLAAGVILAAHFYLWISSLALTSVAASVVLVTTNPLFVGVISHLFLGERLTRRTVLGMGIAILGSAVIGLGDAQQGTHHLTGDLLALLGAVAVAGYMLIGRRLRARLSLLGYIFPVYGTAALVLMTLAVLTGTRLGGYPARTWLWLLLVAVIPQIVGHSALNWALGHLPATYVALSVLAEPVGSTLLAWLVLDETPPRAALLGGALVLTGLVVASRRPRPAPPPA
jgi:drug/metabolite transporter (DMT)-like permease